MNEESICYTCALYSRRSGCTALDDTSFPNYPCPFHKPLGKGVVSVDEKSDCRKCFAGTISGGCGVLTDKPPMGECRFYKTKEQNRQECAKCKERLNKLTARYPKLRDKHSYFNND